MTTRTGKLAIAMTIFVIIAIFAIPNLLSTTYVKQRIADQLSQLSGRQVELQGSSSISLRPYLGVSYDNVIISDEADLSGKPLILIDEFRAKLDLFAALFGDAELAEIEFIRPHFHLRIDESGRRNWSADKGRIGAAINDTEAANSLRLGTVRIEDGILELTDEQKLATSEFTAINGQFSWPDSNAAANTQISAVWRGEIINLAASVANPLTWLQGGASEVSVKIDSNPLKLAFDGFCDGATHNFEGTLSMATPSSKRFADWVGWQLQAPKKLGSFSVSGETVFQNNSLEFPDALVALESHTGKGRLQLGLRDDQMLTINGTLAFETIALPDIQSLLLAQADGAEPGSKFELSFLDGVALDVRLSADTATGAPFAMTGLAAAIIVNDGRASFDIGTAKAIGGSVSGSVSLQAQDNSVAISADIVGNNIELDQLSEIYREKGVALQGRGDITMKLKAVGDDIEGLMLRLNGEGRVSGNEGTLNGWDLPQLYETTLAGSDSVARVSSGVTEFNEINLGYFIANGTAFMRDSFIKTPDVDVSLKGRIDLVRSTLALRGHIKSNKSDFQDQADLPFFIGGTALSPLFVPLPTSIRQPPTQPPPEKATGDQ
ncbi:MAG: AsmA family protein [Rhizobiaceae bacterium]